MRPSIYLAGPTVFMPDKVQRGHDLKLMCEQAGCLGLFPLDANLGPSPGTRIIFESCLAMLTRANAVVADLSPFRGPHVDDGTAFELGFAAARELPVFGYSTDRRPLLDRIARRAPGGPLVDMDGVEIEDFGQPFNAMIAGALAEPAFATAREAIGAAAAALAQRQRL